MFSETVCKRSSQLERERFYKFTIYTSGIRGKGVFGI